MCRTLPCHRSRDPSCPSNSSNSSPPERRTESHRCFDVTPFFALEESYCYYCWDTMDRVTDGKVTFGTSTTAPPCATGSSACGVSGTRTTLFLSLIHISEPTRLGMISYAVFCLKKKK